MTSKLIVNNIEADAGVSTITFGSEISASKITTSSTSAFSSGLNVTGGSVGIGTDNPATNRILHIQKSGFTAVRIEATNSSYAQLELYGIGGRNYIVSDSDLVLQSNSTNAISIDSSQRVGINVLSPGDYNASADNLVIADSGNTGISIVSGTSNTGNLFFADGTAGNASFRGYVQYNHTDNALLFGSNAQERARIDSSGRLLVGAISDGTGRRLQVEGTDYSNSTLSVRRESDDAGGSALELYKSRGSSFNIVSDDDQLGYIRFYGSQGSADAEAARIRVDVDGTTSSTAMPGRLMFFTTPSGSTSPTERMRIDSSGRLLYGTGSGYAVFDNSTTNPKFQFRQTSGEPRGAAFIEDRADSFGFDLYIAKSRGSGTSVVSSGDQLGKIWFTGADGTNQVAGAGILAYVDGTPGNDNMPGRLVFETNSGGSGTTERMRINAAGYLDCHQGAGAAFGDNAHAFRRDNASDTYIAKFIHEGTSIPKGLYIQYRNANPNNNGSPFIICVNSNGSTLARINSDGGFHNYQSNDNNLCDEREKKNIVDLDSTWNCLKEWELKKFHYNDDADDSDLRYGVIAQQIATSCPEVITDWIKQEASDAVLDEDGNEIEPSREEIVRMGVKEQQMYWMAIKALQEAQTRIETLEAKVAALENP